MVGRHPATTTASRGKPHLRRCRLRSLREHRLVPPVRIFARRRTRRVASQRSLRSGRKSRLEG